jgi:prefoldin subunit 5
MTINRLEEQIQILKVKVEDINARLENVTSILQETHSGNVNSLQKYSQKKQRSSF